jgi:hypothetical protein
LPTELAEASEDGGRQFHLRHHTQYTSIIAYLTWGLWCSISINANRSLRPRLHPRSAAREPTHRTPLVRRSAWLGREGVRGPRSKWQQGAAACARRDDGRRQAPTVRCGRLLAA